MQDQEHVFLDVGLCCEKCRRAALPLGSIPSWEPKGEIATLKEVYH